MVNVFSTVGKLSKANGAVPGIGGTFAGKMPFASLRPADRRARQREVVRRRAARLRVVEGGAERPLVRNQRPVEPSAERVDLVVGVVPPLVGGVERGRPAARDVGGGHLEEVVLVDVAGEHAQLVAHGVGRVDAEHVERLVEQAGHRLRELVGGLGAVERDRQLRQWA